MPDDTTVLIFDPHVLAAIVCCFIAIMISFGVFIASAGPSTGLADLLRTFLLPDSHESTGGGLRP